MDALTAADTLDPDYFKKEFATEFRQAKTASADNDPMDIGAFVTLCSDHSLATGQGLKTWVYDMYYDIRIALSDEIQDQTNLKP